MDTAEISSSVASLLLKSLEEELSHAQQNSDVNEKSSVDYIMKQVFSKAGISLTSSTALEVHSKIFREIFITQSRKSTERGAPQFSMLQYFTLLRSEELGWLHFHNELMPYLRLSDATKVLTGLADFYREKISEDLNVTDLKLLLSGLKTVMGIFLDFLASDRSDVLKEEYSLAVEKQNQKDKIDSLLKPGIHCLIAILQILQQGSILPELIKHYDVCKETLEIISLVLILLGPFLNAEQVKQSLLRVYKGKLYLTNLKEGFINKNDKLKRKGQFKEFKEKSNLINFTEPKESGSGVILNKETEKENYNESAEKENCNESAEKENCNESAEKENYNESAEKENCNESAEKENCNESAEKENYNESAEKENCNESAEKENYNESAEKENYNESVEKENYNESAEKENSKESKVSTASTNVKDGKPTLSAQVILRFRSNISVSVFYDVVRFICRGELEENRAFYQLFSDFLCNEEKVCINKHLLDGHSFRLLLVEELVKFDKLKNDITLKSQGARRVENGEKQNSLDAAADSHIKSEHLSSSDCGGSEDFEIDPSHLAMMSDLVGTLSSTEVNANEDSVNDHSSLFYELGKLLAERASFLPRKFLDISQLKLTKVDHLVHSGRGLYGEEDLNLVKKAVSERMCSWKDLLAKGLENKDLKGWWNAGFYDLVWQHEAVLSSETNVAHVLSFLQTLSEQDTKEEDIVSAVNKLFSVMFRRLPTLSQEHLVSSFLAPHEHSVASSTEQERSLQGMINPMPSLSRLKTEQQVLSELTSTLNRLTMSNLKELMPQLLQLCLYYPKSVITQTLSAAVENKGQVASVVEVLRWMKAICHITDPNHQTLISQSLCGALMETELSEVRTQNIINLITLLTQDYTQSMDPWSKEPRQLMAVLSPGEFLLHVIVPSLRGQSCSNDQQEEKQQEMILPLHVSLSVLASVLHSAAGAKLENPLVLLHQLLTVHVSSHQVFVDGQFDQVKLAEKQSSLKCIELLIRVLNSEDGLAEGFGYRWLGQGAIKSGLLATALVYPLLKSRCDLEMKTVLEKMVGIVNSSPGKSTQVMVSLAQLALANDELCAEVMDIVGNMTETLDGRWALPLTSHLLMTSLSCQAPRVGRLLLAFAENSHLCFQTSIEFDLYPTERCFSNKGTLLISVNQLLSASVLHLISWDLSETSLVHILSNYQSFSQVLLSDLPCGDEGPQVLEQYFCHYCFLLSRLEGRSAHVLQVSALDVLSKLKNMQSSKRKATESSINAGMRDGDYETSKKGVGNFKLVDFVTCVKEESVMTQLMKQVRGLKL